MAFFVCGRGLGFACCGGCVVLLHGCLFFGENAWWMWWVCLSLWHYFTALIALYVKSSESGCFGCVCSLCFGSKV